MGPAIFVYILASVAGCSSALTIRNPPSDVALKTRISGGTETTTALNPYVVDMKFYFPDLPNGPVIHDELLFALTGSCTGSIVHKLVVLTAAHCIKQHALAETERSYILVGSSRKNDSNALKIQVKSVLPHPDYVDESVLSDIGLVFARQSLLKDHKGSIIPLATFADYHLKEHVKLLGWGLKSFSGTGTTQLMQCTMWSVPCDYDDFGDPAQYFCTESYSVTPLRGDSGGPVVTMNGTEKLIGVISGGDTDTPLQEQHLLDSEVFPRRCEVVTVAYYYDWIVHYFPQ